MADIITILGARPQFIKAAAVSRQLKKYGLTEQLLHTGQHYDASMSDVFFEELQISKPSWHLNLGGGSHGEMTGQMLMEIERVLITDRPRAVLVYGDTNSTLAGALAAAKLHIPVAHVEAGLRSFNRRMPEEVNRVLTDHVSRWLFCSSDVGKRQLAEEGIRESVLVVGDVMEEALRWAMEAAKQEPKRLGRLLGELAGQPFYLMTLHRAENTDDVQRLSSILAGIAQVERPVVLPLHPRTRNAISRSGRVFPSNVRLMEPFGYLDMAAVLDACAAVLTDSGGLQKEAYWAGKPCVTLRDETEWVETVEVGWNTLVGADEQKIKLALLSLPRGKARPPLYGDGGATSKIAETMRSAVSQLS